jgi:hypothetical protein
MIVKAISIQNPWTWALLEGHTPIDNKPWQTGHRGTIAIHCSNGLSRDSIAAFREKADRVGVRFPEPSDLPRPGAIVALANLLDVQELALARVDGKGELRKRGSMPQSLFPQAVQPWVRGRYIWMFGDITRIDPIPAVGKLGLYSVTLPETLADIVEDLDRRYAGQAMRRVSMTRTSPPRLFVTQPGSIV